MAIKIFSLSKFNSLLGTVWCVVTLSNAALAYLTQIVLIFGSVFGFVLWFMLVFLYQVLLGIVRSTEWNRTTQSRLY